MRKWPTRPGWSNSSLNEPTRLFGRIETSINQSLGYTYAIEDAPGSERIGKVQ